MPIEKKPEQVTISGDDARAAIIDGVQRKLGRRIDEKTMRIEISGTDPASSYITVDVLGARSGRKASGGKPGRKPKGTSTANGSNSGASNMGGNGSSTPLSAAS